MEKNQQQMKFNINQQEPADLLCFSHLKWNFVYQRPQHIMTRMAEKYRLFFIEEYSLHDGPDTYSVSSNGNVNIVNFLLDRNGVKASLIIRQQILVNKLLSEKKIQHFIAWYYTPMALTFTMHLTPKLTVYDCMDELSAFKFAPPQLKILENTLLKRAQLVFTGGQNLYEAKKHLHRNIYPFPSSIDKEHFMQARTLLPQPADQQSISSKRIGFYGVIDERFNIRLIEEIAVKRPEWQLILIGPVVKIEEDTLPRMNNIHYLGGKRYDELPVYLSGWDLAMIPFEKNESTRFISPTKTPEYLAAGKPVISTSITDVVNPYGINNLVHIADNADDFIKAAEKEFSTTPETYNTWLERVDEFLSAISWDITTGNMISRIEECLAGSTVATKLKSVA